MLRRLAFVLCLLLAGSFPVAHALDLTPEQAAGKQIYHRGESPSGGTISALLGDPPMAVSATILPCVNCHGVDGLGRPEGGVDPTPLLWERLTRAYGKGDPGSEGGVRGSGRLHRPYDPDSFARAVREGIDPSGRRLNPAMIRYAIEDDDLAALIEYLKVIDRDLDPGVDDDRVRLAMLVPADGPLVELAEGVRRVLASRWDERNGRGGIFGRSVEVETVAVPDDAAQARELVEVFLADPARAPFALVTPLVPRHETWVRALAEESGVPLVAPLGPPPPDPSTAHHVFHLLPGREDQARALVDALLDDLTEGARLHFFGGEGDTALLAELKERAEGHAPGRVTVASDRSAIDTVDRVLHLGRAQKVAALLEQLEGAGRLPAITAVLGSQVAEPLFSAPAAATVLAAFPVVEAAQEPRARAAYLARLESVGITRPALPFAVADAAAQLVVGALEEAGKDLRREGFIRALEGVYRAELGVVPPITFGDGRRVGVRGASIVRIDLQRRSTTTVTAWRPVR